MRKLHVTLTCSKGVISTMSAALGLTRYNFWCNWDRLLSSRDVQLSDLWFMDVITALKSPHPIGISMHVHNMMSLRCKVTCPCMHAELSNPGHNTRVTW